MSLLSPPQIPLFRITLFYGPEGVKNDPNSEHCIFNVKKRSWKGGVQVEIVVHSSQVRQLEASLNLPVWFESVLISVPKEEQSDFMMRGRDLFVQLICFHKLQARIQAGIRQENTQVHGNQLVSETAELVLGNASEIKDRILTELDIETEYGQSTS